MAFWIRFGPSIRMHQAIQTNNAPQPRGRYSQAVRMGNFLFVSGQLALNRSGNLVKTSLAEERAQVLENLRIIVEAAEGTIADIVQCTIYVTEISHWAEVDGVYGAFFADVPVLPAGTIVPVKELDHGARIEIQATAILNRR